MRTVDFHFPYEVAAYKFKYWRWVTTWDGKDNGRTCWTEFRFLYGRWEEARPIKIWTKQDRNSYNVKHADQVFNVNGCGRTRPGQCGRYIWCSWGNPVITMEFSEPKSFNGYLFTLEGPACRSEPRGWEIQVS